MRKTRPFTPEVLDRFQRQGRGLGKGADFLPWHRVTRGDPASLGRSHLIPLRIGRHLELLSDQERVIALFATMLPGLEDCREQFPLAIDEAPLELAEYDWRYCGSLAPGTAQAADRLAFVHPRVTSPGRSCLWRFSTDLLIALASRDGRRVLAVATKSSPELSRRKCELLLIEQAYWDARSIEWLLITGEQYDRRVGECLERSWPWALLTEPQPLSSAQVANVRRQEGLSLTSVLQRLSGALGSMELAQAAFWQAVWRGELPLDLRRGWRPHEPVVLLPAPVFWDLNPIYARRSAWS